MQNQFQKKYIKHWTIIADTMPDILIKTRYAKAILSNIAVDNIRHEEVKYVKLPSWYQYRFPLKMLKQLRP